LSPIFGKSSLLGLVLLQSDSKQKLNDILIYKKPFKTYETYAGATALGAMTLVIMLLSTIVTKCDSAKPLTVTI